MRTQLFISRSGSPALGEYGPSELENKPFQALWTSTFHSEGWYASAWVEFKVVEAAHPSLNQFKNYEAFLLDVSEEAKVYEIDSRADGNELIRRFPGRKGSYRASINWQEVAYFYDAVHMTRHGQVVTRQPNVPGTSFNGWDVESTAWFRYSFSRVRRYDGPLIRE